MKVKSQFLIPVLIYFSGHFDGEDITKAKDEGIMKRIKENGEGFDHPNVNYFCSLTINRRDFIYSIIFWDKRHNWFRAKKHLVCLKFVMGTYPFMDFTNISHQSIYRTWHIPNKLFVNLINKTNYLNI